MISVLTKRMMIMKKLIFTVFFACVYAGFQAQPTDSIKRVTLKAVELMEAEKFAESREILNALEKEDPENKGLYIYEKAYSYVLEKDYDNAVKISKKLKRKKYRSARGFQLLGNCYSYNGEVKKAIKTYEKGMKHFPNSGRLQLERGNIELHRENYGLAMKYYEKGIEVDPGFASNYYWAAKLYMSSDHVYWGLIYGELFLNLERSGKRHKDVSEVMYKIYEDNMDFAVNDTPVVTFVSNENSISIGSTDMDELHNKMKRALNNYGRKHYQPVMALSVAGESQFELGALSRIRERFVDFYFHEERPDMVLFDFQKNLKEKGYLEAYNYWLFADADEPSFVVWTSQNPDLYKEFVDWFEVNKMKLDAENKFITSDYEF